MNKTILDLWDLDLKSLPNETCKESGKTKNSAGVELTNYTLALEKPSMGLFKLLTIFVFPDGRKIFRFSTPHLASIKLSTVEHLVNALFSVYGKDNNPKPRGSFNANDELEITHIISDPTKPGWPGRMWTLGDHSVMVTLYKEGLVLFIHGVPQSA